MVTITVDLSAIVDGERADAADVTVPFNQVKSAIENTLNGVQAFDKLKAAAFATTQISSGTLSPAKMTASVQAETSTSDDLVTITADNQQILYLKAYPTHSITILETGNIDLAGATSVTLSGNTIMMFVCQNSVWSLLTGISGGAAGGDTPTEAAVCELEVTELNFDLSGGGEPYPTADIAFGSGTEIIDTDDYHSTTVNNSRITIPSSAQAGIYILHGFIRCNGSNPGEVLVRLLLNGSVEKEFTGYTNTDPYEYPLVAEKTKALVANDYVELQVAHNQGDLAVEIARLRIHRIGATPS